MLGNPLNFTKKLYSTLWRWRWGRIMFIFEYTPGADGSLLPFGL